MRHPDSDQAPHMGPYRTDVPGLRGFGSRMVLFQNGSRGGIQKPAADTGFGEIMPGDIKESQWREMVRILAADTAFWGSGGRSTL